MARSSPAFRWRALQLKQERPVDLLDMDAAVLYGIDRIGKLDDFARGSVWVGEGTRLGKSHVMCSIDVVARTIDTDLRATEQRRPAGRPARRRGWRTGAVGPGPGTGHR